MATVIKCDRCGTIYNPLVLEELDSSNFGSDASWRLSIAKDLWPRAEEKKIDLCPDCKVRLNNWLHMSDEYGPASGRR